MPDILIRGMDKPFNCFACDLSRLSGERLFCCVTKDEVLRYKIAPDCPLHELPEHGELIDRDALPQGRVEWDDIDDAPVIVPSNKEESE